MKIGKTLIVVFFVTMGGLSHANDLQELRRYYKSCMNFMSPLLSTWVKKDPDLMIKIIGHQMLDPGFVATTSKQKMFVALAGLADTEVTASDRAKLRSMNFQCEFDPRRLESRGLRSLIYKSLANAEALQSKMNDDSSRLTYREAGGPDMSDLEKTMASLSASDQQVLVEWSQLIMADMQGMFSDIEYLLKNYDMQ